MRWGPPLKNKEILKRPKNGSNSFLEEFPQHTLAVEVRLRQADALVLKGAFAEAAPLFAEVAKQPRFAAADYALFQQGHCAEQLKHFSVAAERYAQLVARFPESSLQPDARLARGRCHFRAGDLPRARRILAELVDDPEPRGSEARHWQCRILLADGQPEAALALIESETGRHTDGPIQTRQRLDRADVLAVIPARRQEAFELYEALIAEHTTEWPVAAALHGAAVAALDADAPQRAAEFARRLGATFPSHPLAADAEYVLAEVALHDGKPADAAGTLRSLIADHPEHGAVIRWRVRLAEALRQLDRRDEALEIVDALATARPEAPALLAEIHYLRGTLRAVNGEHVKAVESFKEVLRSGAEGTLAARAKLGLARSQRALGHSTESKATLEGLAEHDPTHSVDATWQLAQWATENGAPARAARLYAQIAERWPQSPRTPHAMVARATLLLEQAQPAAVVETASSLLEQFPDHELVGQARLLRATAYYQNGNADAALKDLHPLLTSDPADELKVDALLLTSACHVAREAWAAGHPPLVQVLEEFPRSASLDEVLYRLAWIELKQKRQDAADVWLSRLVTERPDSKYAAEAYFHLGEGKYGREDFAAAAQAYEAALRRRPETHLASKAAYKLGWAYYRQDDLEAALAAFRAQLRRAPRGPLARQGRLMHAECLFHLGQFEAANVVYQALLPTAAVRDRVDMLALLHGGQCAVHLERWPEAIDALRRLLDTEAAASYADRAHYELAMAYHGAGKEALAITQLGLAADAGFNEVGARARLKLGQLRQAQQDYTGALREFQQLLFAKGTDEKVPDAVERCQAQAGWQAAQCALALAERAVELPEQAAHRQRAKKYLRHVVHRYPDSGEAQQAETALHRLP